jgi:hypothetical protein
LVNPQLHTLQKNAFSILRYYYIFILYYLTENATLGDRFATLGDRFATLGDSVKMGLSLVWF